jgi:hypothetical protein
LFLEVGDFLFHGFKLPLRFLKLALGVVKLASANPEFAPAEI